MRLELTKKTDLAIQAIQYLCEVSDHALVSGADVAAEIGTTTNFLPQIMTVLVRHGWVASTPGRSGGYRLVEEPDQISVLAIIEAVEGPTVTGRCVLRGAPCPVTATCALHAPWNQARDALLSELDGIPLSEISRRARNEEASDVA